MRVQLDRFEDNSVAVLFLYPGGRKSFDVPDELLPAGSRPGDVFELRFLRDAEETGRMAEENRRLMGELLGRGEEA